MNGKTDARMKAKGNIRKHGGKPLLVWLLSVSLLAACGGGGGTGGEGAAGSAEGNAKGNTAQVKTPDPVTLNLYKSALPDEELSELNRVVKAKYPYITVTSKTGPFNQALLDAMVTTNEVPDLVLATPGTLGQLKEADMLSDVTALMKSNSFDTNRFTPEVWQGAQSYFTEGQTNFIPIAAGTHVLVYNKDLFDKFGVSYPKDGMSWDDAIAVAKKMTRTDGGTDYLGLGLNIPVLMSNNQLSLPFGDPRTSKPLLTTDGWQTWFQTIGQVYGIPGNEVKNTADFTPNKTFTENKTMAMMTVSTSANMPNQFVQASMNWDLVTLPYFKEAPNRAIQPVISFASVTTASKHRDDAFKVISILTSDEWQQYKARQGDVSVLKNPDINKHLFEDNPKTKGKNVAAITKESFAALRPDAEFKDQIRGAAVQEFYNMVLQHRDVITSIRTAQETAEQKVQQLLAK